MISPELLKRFPFFAPYNESQLVEIAMLAAVEEIAKDAIIFEECQPANTLYVLIEGSIELFIKAEEQNHPKTHKEFSVGDINPGEIFALSSMIEPHVLNAGARATQPSKIIQIDALALRGMFEKDCLMGYLTLQQVSKSLMERLAFTRVQLAAAWA